MTAYRSSLSRRRQQKQLEQHSQDSTRDRLTMVEEQQQQQDCINNNTNNNSRMADKSRPTGALINSQMGCCAKKSSLAAVSAVASVTRCKRRQLISRRMAAPLMAVMILALGLVQLLEQGPFALAEGSTSAASTSTTNTDKQQQVQQPDSSGRSTQPTLDRQLDAPTSSSSPTSGTGPSMAPPSSQSASGVKPTRNQRPATSSATSQKKASPGAALAAQQNYDKYQLKATGSYASSAPAVADKQPAAGSAATAQATSAGDTPKESAGDTRIGPASGASTEVAQRKPISRAPAASRPSFSLLRKFFPSFMGSAATAAAAAAAAASAGSAEGHAHAARPHSRSDPAPASRPGRAAGAILSSLASVVASKKSAEKSGSWAIPDHAPFFVRKPQLASGPIDRQAGAASGGLISGLLANPLGLGLLFSAPLLPSLLLTPLAIAGLSPAMSAINNFFGDDDEPAAGSSPSPLAAIAGQSGPLASILQAAGADPAALGSSSSSGSATSSAPSSAANFAIRAFQTVLGRQPSSTTERPLFNPGMFGSSSSGGQSSSPSNWPPSSSAASSISSSSTLTSASNPNRNSLFGGQLMQAAASMISPTFVAPPSGSSSSSSSSSGSGSGSSSSSAGSSAAASEDGPGIIQMASDVFEKVSNFMNTDKEIGQASSASSTTSGQQAPLSTLAALASMSPFQLSSLFASTPIGAAANSHSSSSSVASGTTQRAGFFSTLKNVYELFSSSFLRRQELGDNSNECQQRLICELHQRAMNSKLFKRSLQSNLVELANLDRSLLDQLKQLAPQARVDADTKAMLNDFLKATNNFKSGREMVDCSRMFPKCSRTQLLSAANAHLMDPINGKTIGKFSQLMKKMKFKSNQQHQSQWKLRKPGKSASVQLTRAVDQQQQFQPIDYLQVAPMSPTLAPETGPKMQLSQANSQQQLMPADSLKLVQQIMMMSQMSNQQQQQPNYNNMQVQQQQPQQQYPIQPMMQSYAQPLPAGSQMAPTYSSYVQQQYPQQQQLNAANYQQPQQQTTYTDAIYSSQPATESPYYLPAQSQAVVLPVGAQNQPQLDQMSSIVPSSQPQQQQQQLASQSQQQVQPTGGQQQQYPTNNNSNSNHYQPMQYSSSSSFISSQEQQQQQQQTPTQNGASMMTMQTNENKSNQSGSIVGKPMASAA